MSDQPHPGGDAFSPSLGGRVDQVCDRFEHAWKAGQRPGIEDYLGAVPQPERASLLRELLAVELECRWRNGETLITEDYVRRFPEHADLIGAVFAEAVARARSGEAISSEHPDSTGPEGSRAAAASPPERLGRYRITGTLGRGGFGVVYQGYDDDLRRPVAIKVPHRLSAQEGLPVKEWCYQPIKDRKAPVALGSSTVGLLASFHGPAALLAGTSLVPGRTDARYADGMQLAPD